MTRIRTGDERFDELFGCIVRRRFQQKIGSAPAQLRSEHSHITRAKAGFAWEHVRRDITNFGACRQHFARRSTNNRDAFST